MNEYLNFPYIFTVLLVTTPQCVDPPAFLQGPAKRSIKASNLQSTSMPKIMGEFQVTRAEDLF